MENPPRFFAGIVYMALGFLLFFALIGDPSFESWESLVALITDEPVKAVVSVLMLICGFWGLNEGMALILVDEEDDKKNKKKKKK